MLYTATHLLNYRPKSQIEAVNTLMKDRHTALFQLKAHLFSSSVRSDSKVCRLKTNRTEFKGDWVYLKLQPYRQLSIAGTKSPKLNPHYYGPFEILQSVRLPIISTYPRVRQYTLQSKFTSLKNTSAGIR